jgi:hypothetical protein
MPSSNDDEAADRAHAVLPYAGRLPARCVCFWQPSQLLPVIISLELVVYFDDIHVIFTVSTSAYTIVSSTATNYILYAEAPLVPRYYSYY